ncbi:precorrin-6y C5,15-methyltransferase (decarboxylating) subunit CbiE [Paracoccus zhejiangensis]|uniref:Cobalamin biosynthesis bifunctional protein CbiET n=1 Tax=Paracoccus zhejiangensis TaxID=1077935 RepID=A0A2H5F4W9_9RHOB|nr:precorrin-6y C5,15-methyltransferase (decarboxylating) subunit CbiE [Paracoccus zhejiangensis]AUH66590.1 cobalamin biosynthesis bifunctional protein CbiET [Paracoccus zhejiangensis]
MAEPWLSIIGLGEDGPAGLTEASRAALAEAEIVFGGPRHLALVDAGARGQAWPVPFSLAPVLAARGRRVAVLASGDPFWHGAGGSLMADLHPGEWQSFPVPSSFALAANRLGWRLEEVTCHGLHAAPFERLLRQMGRGQRLICTLRDGAAAGELAGWLVGQGAGDARLWVLERLGGPGERIRSTTAGGFDLSGIEAPVIAAIDIATPAGLPLTPGLPDARFAHDGQITKQPVRALTLCALAPRKGALLWDLGAGSGSISVEWCLQGGRAMAVEARVDRARTIAQNIDRFGLQDRMQVLTARIEGGALPDALKTTRPDAVFIGGGADAALVQTLFDTLPTGTRLVMNAVTLETEALVLDAQTRRGGVLMRIELARATPLGGMRGWTPARPLVQWSVVL